MAEILEELLIVVPPGDVKPLSLVRALRGTADTGGLRRAIVQAVLGTGQDIDAAQSAAAALLDARGVR
jgi:hypothetical protein